MRGDLVTIAAAFGHIDANVGAITTNGNLWTVESKISSENCQAFDAH